MDILLSEQLKRLRREKGTKQENLANHLCISTQAVSKWERGEGYPDITLLPAISSYYNVSIDDLLGVGEIEKKKKLLAYEEKNSELFRQGKSPERVKLWKEAKQEFPNELSVLYNLMWALNAADRSQNADEIIACGERILKESTDDYMRSGTIHCLCMVYYTEKKDVESAKKYANMAGTTPAYALMPYILEGGEAVQYCQTNIQHYVDKIQLSASIMCMKGNYSPEDTIKALEFSIACFNLLYADGNCGYYHTRYSEIFREMAKEYMKLGKREDALACLDKAADHAVSYDTLKDGSFTSFMVNKVPFSAINAVKNYTENECGLLLKILNSQSYAELQDDPRMKSILERLKPIANE